MNSFNGQPNVTRIDGKNWLVVEPLVYLDTQERVWVIPAGFVTDFASAWIGRWALLPRSALYCGAAVLHDYLYKRGVTTRKEADQLYHEAMLSEGISKFNARKAYIGVRIGGWAAWRKHRRTAA